MGNKEELIQRGKKYIQVGKESEEKWIKMANECSESELANVIDVMERLDNGESIDDIVEDYNKQGVTDTVRKVVLDSTKGGLGFYLGTSQEARAKNGNKRTDKKIEEKIEDKEELIQRGKRYIQVGKESEEKWIKMANECSESELANVIDVMERLDNGESIDDIVEDYNKQGVTDTVRRVVLDSAKGGFDFYLGTSQEARAKNGNNKIEDKEELIQRGKKYIQVGKESEEKWIKMANECSESELANVIDVMERIDSGESIDDIIESYNKQGVTDTVRKVVLDSAKGGLDFYLGTVKKENNDRQATEKEVENLTEIKTNLKKELISKEVEIENLRNEQKNDKNIIKDVEDRS